MIECTPVETTAAEHPAGCQDALLAADSFLIKVDFKFGNTAECQIALKDQPHGFSLGDIDDEFALLNVIAERDGASHPHTLAAGGGKLIADALAGDLPLKLGKRQQHVEVEPTHRGRGVELLSDRHERHARASNSSTSLAKSASERVRRSTL